jgi:hypothetical protein
MIIRTARPYRSFTILDNAVLRDAGLSYRARGVLGYILSLPDGAQIDSKTLAERGNEGRDAIRTALSELETVGYLHRERQQDPAGLWRTVSLVYDRPVENPEENALQGESPTPEKPTSENQALIQIPNTNTELKNSDRLGTRLEVCGLCDGTTWTTNDNLEIIRCTCPGGVWPDGNP